MKKYKILLIKEFLIKANSEQEAEDEMVERCTDDSEMLMPHNMEIVIKKANHLPDSFFND